MQSGAIQQLKNNFDALSQRTPDEDMEFWFARDIMEPLGYARWENFQAAINRAIESCKTTGYLAEKLLKTSYSQLRLPPHCQERRPT